MKFYSFWAINAPLDGDTLAAQLTALRAHGFHGAVFQPRFYDPPPAYLSAEWMAALGNLFAAFPDLDLYIQDENGWPAPSVDGRLTDGHPELRQSWVSAYRPGQLPADGCIIAACRHATYAREWGSYADTLNPEVARCFIAMTYDAHLPLAPWFGTPFQGFFCDEPQFGPLDTGESSLALPPLGAIPWTDDLPATYAARTGVEIYTDLPALFHNLPESAAARVRFYETVADLFRERFVQPLIDWCRDHGVRWSGHFKGEEHPYFQLWFSGPLGDLYRAMGHAGVDALERYPGERFFLRQAASVMRQQGTGGIVECCGGGGWGMAPADLSRYLWWLALHGLDQFVLHQAQYRLTPRSLHDWPPSTPFHQPYTGCLPALFARLQAEVPTAPAVHPLLVVAPFRGIMAKLRPTERPAMDVHKASYYANAPAGRLNTRLLKLLHRLDAALIGYDVVSEREFETLLNAEGILGACRYDAVLLAPGCRLTTAGEALAATLAPKLMDHRQRGTLNLPRLAARLRLPAHAAASPLPPQVAGDLFGDRIALLNISPDQPAHVRLTVPALTLDLLPGEARVVPLAGVPAPAATVTLPWDAAVTIAGPNTLLLDRLAQEGETLRTTITVTAAVGPVALVSLVPLRALILDGAEIPLREEEYFHYPELRCWTLPALPAGTHLLTATLAAPWTDAVPPRLWLAGAFGVFAPWTTGPRNTRRSDGPFTLAPVGAINGGDLVASGFPFLHGAATYQGTLILPPGLATALRIPTVDGAALEVAWDGQPLGWTWGPCWRIALPETAPGPHTLTVTLHPTAFNFFGPHHHVHGDPALVCSSHYTGARDFAQPPEEPVLLVNATHVLPLGLGGTVVVEVEKTHVD